MTYDPNDPWEPEDYQVDKSTGYIVGIVVVLALVAIAVLIL